MYDFFWHLRLFNCESHAMMILWRFFWITSIIAYITTIHSTIMTRWSPICLFFAIMILVWLSLVTYLIEIDPFDEILEGSISIFIIFQRKLLNRIPKLLLKRLRWVPAKQSRLCIILHLVAREIINFTMKTSKLIRLDLILVIRFDFCG